MPETKYSSPADERAAALYGSPDPEPTPDPEPKQQNEPKEQDNAPEDDLETDHEEQVAAEGDDENEAQADAGEAIEGQTDSEVEEIEASSVEELAEALEVDADWIQGLTIQQKVNGEMVEVKIADALQSYRMKEAAETHLSEAKAKANEASEYLRKQKEDMGEHVAVFSKVSQKLEAALAAEESAVNWQQLRADDPAEYAAKKKDFEDRRNELNATKQEAVTEYREALQKLNQKSREQQINALPEQRKVLLTEVPEWKNEKVASSEREAVLKYLTAKGFTPQQIEIADMHGPTLSMAIKAWRYDKAKGQTEVAKKRVVKIPKVTKPGKQSDDSGKPKPDPKDRVSILYG